MRRDGISLRVTGLTRSLLAGTLLLLALPGVAATACAGGAADESGRLRVVATTTQIGDFAANVGGDRIALTVLLKPNQDAHDFAPSPSQVRALHRADIILRNGIGLDVFVKKIVGENESRVTIITEGVILRDAPEPGDTESQPEAAGRDPHVWFAVPNAQKMVENVREAFVRADAAGAQVYRQNAARYLAQLSDLDASIRRQVAEVPSDCRKLATDHDTLGYYAEAYGFVVIGSVIPSISTEAKPSATDVAEIVRRIREERVPAIFAEASLNPALIRQVGREAGVKVVDDLYGDSLGPKGSDGDTYIKMMEANTRKIVEALKGCG